MNAALLSSKNMCWCTPQDFFDRLNAEFGFVLDPAATDKTAKCSLYYTPETDGLSQSWDRGGAVFCNPPYGREIGKWVQKAFEEARGGVSDCFTYPSADGYGIFSRLHLRESGNPLRARAATVHGRRRERRRSRAHPYTGSSLERGAGEGIRDKKKCPFCEAIALQRFIEEHHSKPAGFGMALSAALVSYAVVNGRKCGRTTDYMKDGKGYPLNYCPSCGRRVKNE